MKRYGRLFFSKIWCHFLIEPRKRRGSDLNFAKNSSERCGEQVIKCACEILTEFKSKLGLISLHTDLLEDGKTSESPLGEGAQKKERRSFATFLQVKAPQWDGLLSIIPGKVFLGCFLRFDCALVLKPGSCQRRSGGFSEPPRGGTGFSN